MKNEIGSIIFSFLLGFIAATVIGISILYHNDKIWEAEAIKAGAMIKLEVSGKAVWVNEIKDKK